MSVTLAMIVDIRKATICSTERISTLQAESVTAVTYSEDVQSLLRCSIHIAHSDIMLPKDDTSIQT